MKDGSGALHGISIANYASARHVRKAPFIADPVFSFQLACGPVLHHTELIVLVAEA